MAKRIFLFFSCFLFSTGFCQKTDSIIKLISVSKQDTSILPSYKSLIELLQEKEDYKTAVYYNQQLYDYGVRIKYPKAIATHYLFKADILSDQSEYQNSIKYNNRALALFDSLHLFKQVAITYRRIADAYYEMANYNNAVEAIFKEIKIEEQLGEKKLLSGAYLNLGNAYRVMEDYKHAELYYLKSFSIKKEINDSNGIANCYNNLGLIYRKKNDYKKALEVYHQSLAIYKNLKNTKGIIRSYTNIGVAYKYLKEYSNALIFFKQAFDKATVSNNRSYLANLYNNIAQLYIIQNQPIKALPLLDSAVFISAQDKSIEDLYTAHEYLSKAYNLTRNFEKAYKNHVLYKHLHDSIYNEENSKTISDLRTQFEVEKKEVEVKAIAEVEKQKLKDLAEVQKTKGIIIITSVAFLLIVTIAFLWVLFKRFSVTKRQKQIIEKQKEYLTEKQQEIIDSITYAKRLQLAILPSLSRFKKHLPESFIFYKPKDIVAGDFYWLHHISLPEKEIIFVAAADSTGHGVPGAMVSVVCSNALNRVVKEFGLTNTGAILDKTRELVLETFSKSGEEIKDGMDISLCKMEFDNATNAVRCQWSGANNVLWYTTSANDTGVEMRQIKPDKQAIGLVENPQPFKAHDFVLRKGETLYLLTDGFADQFGGDKGKKFKYKPLEALLLSISGQSLDQQAQMLQSSFDAWKGNHEQVDDVTIIAIKV